ncbi:MAG: single-stranded-DNA-specific exonuclease RecJ [Clostridiales bacterium]
MDYKINLLNKNIKLDDELVEAAYNNPIIAKIFYNRGYKSPDKIREMLSENLYSSSDPKEFKDMKKTVERIVNAISKNEKIAIYGDYDVDGVTSTVLLMSCLNRFTDNVIYHVPDRFLEGYGMNINVINKFKEKSVDLIITCDCGISNIEEIQIAKELEMDVIVTDHHTLPDVLPNADFILNPKLLRKNHRARDITGCAMAYFLCCELYEYYNLKSETDEFLDLVAISTIADVVPLRDENRYLLKKGMKHFLNTKRIGLRALIDVVEKNSKIETEEDIAFQIAPRINAAGRMDSARLPVDMLLSPIYENSINIAKKIDELNKARKEIQQKIIDEAINLVEERKKNNEVLVLYSDYWHHGIIGIAAGKISETYNKPAILLSLKEDGKTIVGSARSIEEINIYNMINKCSKYLLKFGGHSQAAGLSLDKNNLKEFEKKIEIVARRDFNISEEKNIDVDLEMNFKNIDNKLYNDIRKAGPFGEGFRAPLFTSKGVSVLSDRVTPKNHHIMILEDENNIRLKGVKWFGSETTYQGKVFNFVYKISKNFFRGNDEIQISSEYILESFGEINKVFSGKFIDFRKYDYLESINKLKDKGLSFKIFYEGLSKLDNVGNYVVDRNTVKKTDHLIFISPPLNFEYMREVLSYVNPEFIYINNSIFPDYRFKEFILNCLKFIKYIVNNFNGEVTYEEFSVKLMIEENVIYSILKYLNKMGLIDYCDIKNDSVKIKLVKKSISKDKSHYEIAVRNALKEKEAYLRYISTMDIELYLKYLN